MIALMAPLLSTRFAASIAVAPAIREGLEMESERAQAALEHGLVRRALVVVRELVRVARVARTADDKTQASAEEADTLNPHRLTFAREQPRSINNFHASQCTVARSKIEHDRSCKFIVVARRRGANRRTAG